MAAFNTILLDAICPICRQNASIECQEHVAASFDGNDSGRFCMREYRIGDQLAWWKQDDKKYKSPIPLDAKQAEDDILECCYATCQKCNGDLYAVIRFEGLLIKELVELGPEENWPEDFSK